jgi:hypothetical protein
LRVEIGAEVGGDPLAGRVAGLVGHAHRVGTHVGDQRRGAAFTQLHAFVETLGHGHGPLGVEAELVAGVLLQGGRDEGRARVALAFLFGHVLDQEGPAGDAPFQGQGRALVADDSLGAVDLPQVGLEGRGRGALQRDLENPVLLGNKGLAFALAVHDEAQGHGLDPAGGQAALDLFPEQGGNLVAHEPVQDASGLLGVEEGLAQFRWVGQGLFDRLGRDLVELDALEVGVGPFDDFGHVPGDGLALAVGVRGQVYGIGRLGCGFEFADDLGLAGDDLILRREVVLLVHAEGLGGQIPHVPHGRFHFVTAAQKLLDGFYFGG